MPDEEQSGVRVVLIVNNAHPELLTHLSSVPVRMRAERIRYLAALGLQMQYFSAHNSVSSLRNQVDQVGNEELPTPPSLTAPQSQAVKLDGTQNKAVLEVKPATQRFISNMKS